MDIEKILAVLDMTEEEQWRWLCSNVIEYEYGGEGHHYKGCPIHGLATLAFRMRDEWFEQNKKDGKEFLVDWYSMLRNMLWLKEKNSWPSTYKLQKLQPIHWIVATLIAQEQSK